MKEPKFNLHRRTAALLGIAFIGSWVVGSLGAYFYTDNISQMSVALLGALFVVVMVLSTGLYAHARRADRLEREGWEQRKTVVEQEHKDAQVSQEPFSPPKETVLRDVNQQRTVEPTIIRQNRYSLGPTSAADQEERRRRQRVIDAEDARRRQRVADEEEDERRRRQRDDEMARQNQVNLTNAMLFSSLSSPELSRVCSPDPAPAPPVEYSRPEYERCDPPPAPPAPSPYYESPSPPPPSYDPPASSPSYDSPSPSPSSDW